MGHDHGIAQVSDRVLLWAILLNVALSFFEFIGGGIAGSVALMADALHNTNDATALIVAYVARKISQRGADRNYTFGYRLAALVDGQRKPERKSGFLHNLTDAGASLAVLCGGAAIVWLGWHWVDPANSLVIAAYILVTSTRLLRRTSHILMQGSPRNLDIEQIKAAAEKVDGVTNIHHVHLWELDEDNRSLEAHVVIEDERLDLESIKEALKRILMETFDIRHSTLKFETASHACMDAGAETIVRHD